MRAPQSATAIVAFSAAFALTGCAANSQMQTTDRELRRMVVETRRELEEVRHDQERLRALVEYMQYAGGGARGLSDNYPPPTAQAADPRWGGDGSSPSWSYQSEGDSVDASADDYDASTVPADPSLSASADGRVASAAPAGFPGGVGYPSTPSAMENAQPGAPMGGTASRETTGGIVAGIRGGGNWVEPGESGLEKDVPHVPVKLRGSGFDDGVRAFVDRNYDDAIQYFRDFIHRSPSASYSDDAQYWIGESYLRKGLYSNAIKEFNQVVLRYGSGDRSAASLLKLAKVFSKIGDNVDARLSLQKLVNRYPGSLEAERANSLLQQMGG